MSQMRRSVVTGLTLLLATMGNALADSHKMLHKRIRERPALLEGLRQAGAPADVIKKVEQAKFDAAEQRITSQAELKKAQLGLRRLLTAPTPDSKAVLAQVDRVNKARGELAKQKVSHELKVRELVGAELWQKMRDARPQGRRHGVLETEDDERLAFGEDGPDDDWED